MDVVATCKLDLLLFVTTQVVYYNNLGSFHFVVWNLPVNYTRKLTEALRLKSYLV